MNATGQNARRPRGRPRDPDADDAILRAALDVFVERGAEGASIEEVARRAGVAKLTVYRRWSGKEELLAQAIESARDILTETQPDIDLDPGLSVADQVTGLIPAAVATLSQPGFRDLVARIFGARVSHPRLLEVYWDRYVRPRRQEAGQLLDRAKREGMVATDIDNDVLIDMMVGAITYRLLQPDPLDARQIQRHLEGIYRQIGLLP